MEKASQTEVQLYLHNADAYPVELFDHTRKQNHCTIRVQSGQQADFGSKKQRSAHGPVILKILRGYECLEVEGESHHEKFNTTEFYMFRTRTQDLLGLVLCISVYDDLSCIGTAYLTSAHLHGSAGKLSILLTDDSGFPVGLIKVEYLVVKPWIHSLNTPLQSGSVTCQGFGTENGQAFICGHRGAGESFETPFPSRYPENTISAFKAAKTLGHHFVEMDVHITKDLVPVVYHDFTVNLCLEKFPCCFQNSASKNSIPCEVPLKDLTLEQLKQAKVWKQSEAIAEQNAWLEKSHHSADETSSQEHDDTRLFPTLEEVFSAVPPDVGFFIELKYPLEEMDGENVDHLGMDQNHFIDTILQTVFESAGSRKLFFLCFDPNICTMAKLKQSRFPVLFLSCCENDQWSPYKDMRARTTAAAVAFALSHNLDGVSLFSTPLIQSPSEIEKVRQAGLILSTWGEQNNDRDTRKWQEKQGVQYITLDRP